MGSAAVIPWAAIARLSEPNESPCWEETQGSLSIALWRGEELKFPSRPSMGRGDENIP